MLNIWRRIPGRLQTSDFIKDRLAESGPIIAGGFWEYSPPPPSGHKIIPGITPPYESTPA